MKTSRFYTTLYFVLIFPIQCINAGSFKHIFIKHFPKIYHTISLSTITYFIHIEYKDFKQQGKNVEKLSEVPKKAVDLYKSIFEKYGIAKETINSLNFKEDSGEFGAIPSQNTILIPPEYILNHSLQLILPKDEISILHELGHILNEANRIDHTIYFLNAILKSKDIFYIILAREIGYEVWKNKTMNKLFSNITKKSVRVSLAFIVLNLLIDKYKQKNEYQADRFAVSKITSLEALNQNIQHYINFENKVLENFKLKLGQIQCSPEPTYPQAFCLFQFIFKHFANDMDFKLWLKNNPSCYKILHWCIDSQHPVEKERIKILQNRVKELTKINRRIQNYPI